MNAFFVRAWKPFLIVFTILFVLIFQCYWLWNNFQNHKREILEQTKIEMQKVLMNTLIIEKSIEANQNIDDKTKAMITEKLSEIIDINSLSAIGGEVVIMGEDDDDIIYSNMNSYQDVRLDSMLYFTMKSYMQKEYNRVVFELFLCG